MINQVIDTLSRAFGCLGSFEKETDLNAKQIAKIRDLRKEIKDLCNSDLFPTPQNEFQKLEQLKGLYKLYEDSNHKLSMITPQNAELFLLWDEIVSLTFQIMTIYDFHLGTLSESARKEFFEEQTPQTKTIDKDNELQKKLVEVLGGRKELAEELININSQNELHNWCREHSGELYTKVTTSRLFGIVKDLKIIENLSIVYETFNNWLKGK